MTIYYDVVGIIEGEKEQLFGSFDRADCVSEIECEGDSWEEMEYTGIKIVERETTDKPDATIYNNLVSESALQAVVNAENEGELQDYINDDLVTKCGDGYLINDKDLQRTIREDVVTKSQLWCQQAEFKHGLDEDQLLKKALKAGFVTFIDESEEEALNKTGFIGGRKLYLINRKYEGKNS